MKNLLIAFEMSSGCAAPWAKALCSAAFSISDAFDSYIEAVGVLPSPPTSALAGDMDLSLADARRSCTEADAYREYEMAFGAQAGRECTWSGLLTPNTLAQYARPFDLVIMARPELVLGEPTRESVENALFESGRPILLTSDWAGTIDGTIVVSWTDTVETARAMTASLPLLQRASRVHLVSVQKEDEPPPTAERAARLLHRHGVNAECAILVARGSVGETVLGFTKTVGADLLVKGAYTQTRLRRLIFGGTTDYILSHCELPLLLMH